MFVFEQVVGKKSVELSLDELLQKAQNYSKVHIDLGTGDGLYPWREARKEENADTFFIGIDASRDSLREGSGRAIKKPARGGAPNVVYLCMNILEMGDELNNLADKVTVNFPWGSLLDAVALPFDEFLPKLAALLKPEGILEENINMYVFVNEEQRAQMGLPEIDDAYLADKLFPAYEKAGFELTYHAFMASGQKTEIASTWGSKLTRRSGRPTLKFTCIKKGA